MTEKKWNHLDMPIMRLEPPMVVNQCPCCGKEDAEIRIIFGYQEEEGRHVIDLCQICAHKLQQALDLYLIGSPVGLFGLDF